MEQSCLACGVLKDPSIKEVYPYPEDGLIDEPINPLMTLDCQGPLGDCRVVTVCHACFHRLDPDMWISDRCWLSLDPVTPFAQLPALGTR